jgi:amidase
MTGLAGDDLGDLDAVEQARLVRDGQVRPIDLVEASIARIERLNPALNAVITPLFDQARTQAVAKDLPGGPFRGVQLAGRKRANSDRPVVACW